jgi:hypothetical protein
MTHSSYELKSTDKVPWRYGNSSIGMIPVIFLFGANYCRLLSTIRCEILWLELTGRTKWAKIPKFKTGVPGEKARISCHFTIGALGEKIVGIFGYLEFFRPQKGAFHRYPQPAPAGITIQHFQ